VPFFTSSTSSAVYLTTLANGLEFYLEWFCVAGIFGTHNFSVSWCDISRTCFARVSGGGGFTSTALCSLTPGSTSPFSLGARLTMVEGPVASCEVNSPSYAFASTLTFTPSW
jgi:hypothetical protein